MALASNASRQCLRCLRHPARTQRRDYSYSSRGKYRRGANHIDSFYDDLMSQKKPGPQTRTAPAPPPPENPPKTDREERLQKARVVFGSRLAGPVDRRRDLQAASERIAGVLVPPRPDEPDNCCMSGCVNCVWDRYRDELEEWADKRAEADRRLARQNNAGAGRRERKLPAALDENAPAHVAVSMDDDGGGSETNWDLGGPRGSGAAQDLFADIPVGIREFMRTEKRLKQSKLARKAAAAAS